MTITFNFKVFIKCVQNFNFLCFELISDIYQINHCGELISMVNEACLSSGQVVWSCVKKLIRCTKNRETKTQLCAFVVKYIYNW